MILQRFRLSTGKIQHDLVVGLFFLYGLWYALCAFSAPLYFFLADGVFPMVSIKEGIDDVGVHYARLSGAVLLGEILHWYLFCVGRVEHERMMIKTLICNDIIAAFVLAQTASKDVDTRMYIPGRLQAFMISFIIMALYWYHRLTKLPATKRNDATTVPLKTTNADRIYLAILSIYFGMLPAKCLISGPARQFFPPETEFSIIHIHNARIFGSQATALLIILVEGLVTNKSIPKLTYKLICLISILASFILFKEVYDNEHFVRKNMIPNGIVLAGIGSVAFNNLGAFEKNDVLPEDRKVAVKAKA